MYDIVQSNALMRWHLFETEEIWETKFDLLLLFSTTLYATGHGTARHSTAQHNATQHNTIQHQHNTTPLANSRVSGLGWGEGFALDWKHEVHSTEPAAKQGAINTQRRHATRPWLPRCFGWHHHLSSGISHTGHLSCIVLRFSSVFFRIRNASALATTSALQLSTAHLRQNRCLRDFLSGSFSCLRVQSREGSSVVTFPRSIFSLAFHWIPKSQPLRPLPPAPPSPSSEFLR